MPLAEFSSKATPPQLANPKQSNNNVLSIKILPLTLVITGLMLSACSSTPTHNSGYSHKTTTVSSNKKYVYTQPNRVQPTLDADSLDELAELLEATDMQAVEDSRLAVLRYGDLWKRIRSGFGLNLNRYDPRITAQQSWFISRQDYINRLSARASRYFYYTISEAERRGIPTELALLPIIESSYDPTATSNAAAAGMWQFIPSTGRIYGLNQTASYDGRRDVIESTRAAYDFLTSLYNKFGSWELALAAYNAGPGRVQSAINANAARGLSTDYWSLRLPSETMNYVPRFLAVAQIVNDPAKYGVRLPSIANRPHFRSVPVQTGVSLNDISRVTGLSRDELYQLNPALSNGVIADVAPNRVLIPNSVNSSVDAKITALAGQGFGQPLQVNRPSQLSQLPSMNHTLSRQQAAQLMSSPQTNRVKGDTLAGAKQAIAQQPVKGDNVLAAQQAYDKYTNIDLPKSAAGLAEFVSSTSVPNQKTQYIQPKGVVNTPEPKINQQERQQVLNQLLAEQNSLPTTAAAVTQNETVVQEPALSPVERQQIADEIKAQVPNVSEVIDPIDGEIKLEAIQTQQSVLEAKGQERKLSFEDTTQALAKPKQPQGKRTTYTVQAGDTLVNIAQRAGVKWRDIAKWNQIDFQKPLYIGSTLYLYNAKAIQPLQTSQPKPESYRVVAGDTLTDIANNFGLSNQTIASYNNISPLADVYVGQKLWLVAGKVNPETNNTTTQPSKPKLQSYKVKAGDGLIALAKRFGMSVEKLAELNKLPKNTQLLVGQKLLVPTVVDLNATTVKSASSGVSSHIDTTTYNVKSGESLIGIADDLGVSAKDIAQLNPFNANARLQRGQTITVPVTMQTYTVKAGDGLIALAHKNKISVATLAAANGLSTRAQLRVGQTLNVPTSDMSPAKAKQLAGVDSTQPSTDNNRTSEKPANISASFKNGEKYRVQSGDTLIGLAKRFKVEVAELAKANKLSTHVRLQRGQILTVPKLTAHYKVRSGDSLIGLAKKYGITPQALADMNQLKSNAMLRLGQVLVVPSR